MSEILWQPSAQRIEQAKLTAFRRFVHDQFARSLDDYESLYAWSIRQPALFWEAVWRFSDIRASRTWDRVLTDGDAMPGARWFEGARLNYAENLLRQEDRREAIVFRGEGGASQRITHAELAERVRRMAAALWRTGVRPGDRVAGFLPNLPETVIAMLGAASLGAVWSSCSPDFGVAGVIDRFGQIEPRVLVTADGYIYGGKLHDSLSRVRQIVDRLPSVGTIVVVPYQDETPDLSGLQNACLFDEFVESGSGEASPATAASAEAAPFARSPFTQSPFTQAPFARSPFTQSPFAQLPFAHPLLIMYSSGTTGLPKCMVHTAGGTLIQHQKEHVLHCDIGPEDRVFYFTTCGWMMWNWLVSSLATGATLMLYDGSPTHPSTALWDFAAEEGITVFGTSAKYLAASESLGLRPRESHDLSALRAILSTGSPLLPETFDYVYRDIKEDVCLSSISGGTDIISCFALGNPVLPVRRGELQCRGLGMDVQVFDDLGHAIVGQKGELVCTAPFPSMPSRFWQDDDGSRYRAAYFERFPGVWSHGDYAELRPEGGMVIHGRSDAVLNPGGVRIGTAEIYSVVERFDEVVESIVVGQEWQGDVRVVLFVVLRDGTSLDDGLRDRLRHAIRQERTPRHVPAQVLQVAAIPRTLSGKIVEVAVRETIHGRPVRNVDALANPEALELFAHRPELAED